MIGQVDSNGNLSGPFPYDPYGGSSTTGTQSYGPFQFAAQEHDVDSSGGSIYYMRARYYLPLIDRFISRDPAGGGVNPYIYAGDSPTNFTDPTGMWGWPGLDVPRLALGLVDLGATDLALVGPSRGGNYFYKPPVTPVRTAPQNGGIDGAGAGYPISNGGGLGSQILLAGMLFTPDSGEIPQIDPEGFGGGEGSSTFISGGSEGGGGGGSDANPGDLKILTRSQLKGINAERFKEDIVGKAGGRFNIAVAPNGQVYLVPVVQGGGPPVATGMTESELRGNY